MFAAIAIAAAALGSAPVAAAAPTGPCADVPYVGVCDPLRKPPMTRSRQGMPDVPVVPSGQSQDRVQAVG